MINNETQYPIAVAPGSMAGATSLAVDGGAARDHMTVAQIAEYASSKLEGLAQEVQLYAGAPGDPERMLELTTAMSTYFIDMSYFGAVTKSFVKGVETLTRS
jgi:hypothetical protein